MIHDACLATGRTPRPVTSDEPLRLPGVLESGDVPAVELATTMKTNVDVPAEPAHLAIPEHSHPGESKTNGLAERAVQTFEDQFVR